VLNNSQNYRDNNTGFSVKNTNDQANWKAIWMKPESHSSSNLNNGWMVPYKLYDVKGPISDSNPNVDSSRWVLCNEVQLIAISLKRMEIIYNDTVSKLVALGHNEDIVVKVILHNAHCYGANDLATDLLHNTLACFKKGNLVMYESKPAFSDLKKLEEYTLMNLVSLLQEVRLELGPGDAMWCLLMCDYNVLKAITIHIPVVGMNMCPPLTEVENEEWRFRKEWGSDIPFKGFFCGKEMTIRLHRDIEFPKRFDLTPAMICSLKSTVAAFADGYKANSEQVQSNAEKISVTSTVSKLDSLAVTAVVGDLPGHSHSMNDQDNFNSVLSKFHDLNIDENVEYVAEDEKDSMIFTLLHQIKDLRKQVKERKDWAHEKAIQAARKLNSHLIELKTFRIEKEDNQRLNKEKEANEEPEDPAMVRLLEMEEALRKTCGQMDLAAAGVGKLEAEKAEIKAELEACKLSASESVASCLQIAKREKKCLKKLLAWEKQEAKLKQDISDEKQKILEIQEELAQIKQRAKEAEVCS